MDVEKMVSRAPFASAVALAVAAMAGMIYLAVAPEPEPTLPPIESFSVSGAPGFGPRTATGTDFADRPLLSPSRSPSVTVDDGSEQLAEEESSGPVRNLDGHVLLGVFASGGRDGVIVGQESRGNLERVFLGEALKSGWVLASVEPRAANFEADGTKGRLEMLTPLPLDGEGAVMTDAQRMRAAMQEESARRAALIKQAQLNDDTESSRP